MATIKSYTDREQSKRLSGILPIESADMCYIKDKAHLGFLYKEYKEFADNILQEYEPCWSLAALFGVLPRYELNNFGETIQLDVNREALSTEGDETLLDLVVNMVIHLHEQNLL